MQNVTVGGQWSACFDRCQRVFGLPRERVRPRAEPPDRRRRARSRRRPRLRACARIAPGCPRPTSPSSSSCCAHPSVACRTCGMDRFMIAIRPLIGTQDRHISTGGHSGTKPCWRRHGCRFHPPSAPCYRFRVQADALFSSVTGEWRNGRRAGFGCQCPSGRGVQVPFAHISPSRDIQPDVAARFVSGTCALPTCALRRW